MANDNNPMVHLINELPDLIREARSNAEHGWGGSTFDMMRASYDVIEVLKGMWLRLSNAYPEMHFGGVAAGDYIERFVQDRFVWHRAINEVQGVGTGGTIVGPMSAMGVMGDLEQAVEQTALALMNRGIADSDFDVYREWLTKWRNAVAR